MSDFVYDLGLKEDNLEKRRKIDALRLNEEEWDRVGLFCDLLGVSVILSNLLQRLRFHC